MENLPVLKVYILITVGRRITSPLAIFSTAFSERICSSETGNFNSKPGILCSSWFAHCCVFQRACHFLRLRWAAKTIFNIEEALVTIFPFIVPASSTILSKRDSFARILISLQCCFKILKQQQLKAASTSMATPSVKENTDELGYILKILWGQQ